jgi:MFS family permease
LSIVPKPPVPGDVPPAPSRRSLRGLDWFVFCVADIQTGFGPFLAVYLTTQKWTQTDIGLILSVSGLVALAGQMPGGWLVDAARSERFVAGVAIIAISIAALTYATFPIFAAVLFAAVLHAAASCVLGPAIAAISLGLVGHAAIGERFGRNARFASIGNGLAAAAMGATGHFFSARAVFVITAVLLAPTLLALRMIKPQEINVASAHGGVPDPNIEMSHSPVPVLLHKRPLLIFAGCIMLFHLANAAMLPLMGGVLTTRSSEWATVLIAACIVVPQIIVAVISPWVGRQSGIRGRRPLLIIGFAALPIRAVLFATVTDPHFVVFIQILDGLTAAVLGVMVPLIIADLTRGTGRFNLAQGIVGTMTGIGAAASTTIGGYLIDHFGSQVTFLGLGALAAVALTAALAFMPETQPDRK